LENQIFFDLHTVGEVSSPKLLGAENMDHCASPKTGFNALFDAWPNANRTPQQPSSPHTLDVRGNHM